MLSAPAGAWAAKGFPEPTTQAATVSEMPKAAAKVLAGEAPRNVADLKAMEQRFRQVAEAVMPATVGVGARGGSGSGVIISADGYVLTVGHITREAGRDLTILLPDGRRAKAKTLGANLGVDAGLIKITDEPKDKAGWPHCRIGASADLKTGQWVLAAGHPGGFRSDRTPPVRVGRVLRNTSSVIVTDCTIVSGDSGGPLYDMDGKVIGISSRISNSIEANVHVPVDVFRRDWDRLAKGEVFGSRSRFGGAYLGVRLDMETPVAKIVEVLPGSAAEKAGLKADDVVKSFGGKTVRDRDTLLRMIVAQKPGDKVTIVVLRGKKETKVEAVLSRRPG